jgi:3-phenylpropionate/trans-cinnamate dioxygenase ferredoxin component
LLFAAGEHDLVGGRPLVASLEVCPLDELPPGSVKIVRAGQLALGVYNVDGDLYAIEDRCSHDDGPLCEGDWDPEERVVTCPRHGSNFDLRTGEALTLPAYVPVDTFPVRVEDGIIKVDV